MTVEWVDQNTLTALNWQEIWADYTPTTVYGRRAKAKAVPYLPGQEAKLQHLWDQLQDDLEKLSLHSPQQIDQLISLLQNWPDLQDTFSLLSQPTARLTAKHALALKQFAFRGRQLARTLEEQALVWTDSVLWEQLLVVFGNTESSSFALDHVANDSYRRQAAHHAAAARHLAMATRERDAAWHQSTGERVHRDGRVVLNLPEQQLLAQGFKQDAHLRWLHDTPFESVFELLPTPSMEAAAAKLTDQEEQLAAAADALFAQLTETIRTELALWHQAELDLRELDLRLARVQLARRWDGCVPQLGTLSNRVELSQGVHPLLAKQLQKRGKGYVPLNFAPEEGVNVVFGSNMGGKTVAMSLLAVSQLCAQYGLPVPAKRFVTRLFPVIRFCASAESDLGAGLSSFGVEMTRLASAWRDLQACKGGLLCLDEPGRSTNPLEGEALVIGVIRAAQAGAMGEHSVLVLASHFAAVLYEAKAVKFRVRGLRPGWNTALVGVADPLGPAGSSGLVALEEWMDYRLERVEGEADFVTEALPVAEWLGLPSEVLIESRHFLQRGKKP